MKSLFLLLSACCLSVSLMGQQLPRNPHPDKCYIRGVTPDVYETETEEYLTYSVKEAALYPHKRQRIVVKPELSQWESVVYDGCESPNPNDCQVLCYKTYPGEYKIVYRPKDESLGKPFYREITRSFLVEKGGLSSYEEIDCALTSYQLLGPLDFGKTLGQYRDEERILQDQILTLLDEYPAFRLQFQFRYSGSKPESEGEMLEAYLVEKGVNPGSLVFQYLSDDQLSSDELEVHWRVLNVDN